MKRTWTLSAILLVAIAAPGCDTAIEDDGATPTVTDTTDSDTNGSDTNGSDTANPDSSSPASPVEVTGFNAITIASGGDTSPLTLGGVPPFSMGSTDLNFYNVSSSPLTLTSVSLEVVAPTEAYEFALTQSGRTERLPVQTTNIALDPNEGVSFGIHFIPLASGPRDVKVRFAHTAGPDFVVTVHARGRDNASFSPHVATRLQRLLARDNTGHSNGLELGGLAADPAGNLYFSGNGNEWGDGFNANLVLGRMNADGSLAWTYEWNEKYEQSQADVGNNGDTGGPADAIDVDAAGNVYATGYRVPCGRTAGAPEDAFVVSVASDGSLRWVRSLNNGANSDTPSLVKQYLRGYAIDASLPDRVLVAGRVTASGGFLLAALDKSDGSLIWAHDISYGAGESRVGALVVDAAHGVAYVGGIQKAVPFMVRVDGVALDAPTITWAHDFQLNATSVHGATLDGDGLLVALENRGLSTKFIASRIATANGSVVWSRIWDATNAGDSNASLTVVKHKGTAVFGGRVAINPFDTQGGDGFLLGLDPASGAYRWGAFHYGGKGAEEMAHDYVVALVSTSAGLWALHQQTPGSNNHHHFWGRWYTAPDFTLELPAGDGAKRLVDGGLAGVDVTADTELLALTDVVGWDTMSSECGNGAWVDRTSLLETTDPIDAEADELQAGTHGLLQALQISE